MAKKFNIHFSMVKTIIVFIITITIFIGCREASKPVINPIEFNLLTNSDLKYLYMFFGCIKDSALVDEISFLEIRNNTSDTFFVDTYSYHQSIYLMASYSELRKYNGEYLFGRFIPFYPSLVIDTIYPYKKKVYPFGLPSGNKLEDGLILVEPPVMAKSLKPKNVNFPKGLKEIKNPFIIYKVTNGDIIDITDEFVKQFDDGGTRIF